MPKWKQTDEDEEDDSDVDLSYMRDWKLKRVSFVVHLDLWIKSPETESEVEQNIFDMIKTNIDADSVEVERTSASLGLMKDAIE